MDMEQERDWYALGVRSGSERATLVRVTKFLTYHNYFEVESYPALNTQKGFHPLPGVIFLKITNKALQLIIRAKIIGIINFFNEQPLSDREVGLILEKNLKDEVPFKVGEFYKVSKGAFYGMDFFLNSMDTDYVEGEVQLFNRVQVVRLAKEDII